MGRAQTATRRRNKLDERDIDAHLFMFEIYKNVHAFRNNGKEECTKMREKNVLPGESQKPSGSSGVSAEMTSSLTVSVSNYRSRLFIELSGLGTQP